MRFDDSIIEALDPYLDATRSISEGGFDRDLLLAIGHLREGGLGESGFDFLMRKADELSNEQMRATIAGQTVALIVAVCRICIAPPDRRGYAFWQCIPRSVVERAFRLLDRATPNGYKICWNAVVKFSPEASRSMRRRDAIILHRLNRHDYWPAHWFADALDPGSRLRFRAIRILLRSHPEAVGNIASIIINTDANLPVPEVIQNNFLKEVEASCAAGSLRDWRPFFVAQVLERIGEFAQAFKIILACYDARENALIRFEELILMSRLARQMYGKFPQLRLLVTALRILPEHVSAGRLQTALAELACSVPDVRVSGDIEDFSSGLADVLRLDTETDFSPSFQYWLQETKFLTSDEALTTPLWGAPNSKIVRNLIVHDMEIKLYRLPNPAKMRGEEDAWEIAKSLETVLGKRRRVLSLLGNNIFMQLSGNYSLVYSEEGNLLPEASAGHCSFFRGDKILNQPFQHLKGNYFSLCVPFGHDNYSHFLLDRLPRLAFAENWMNDINVLVDRHAVNWTSQLLRSVGSRATVIPVDLGQLYKIDQVTLFNKPQHPLQLGYGGYINFLRQLVPDWEGRKRFRRVVIHRDRGRRGLDNEFEFYGYMASKGFQIVKLEALPIIEQLCLFAEAETIVGVHGAGLSNAVACKPGATVIEILPVGYFTPAFAILCRTSGVRYVPYLEASDRNRRLATNFQLSDTNVTLARWADFIDKVGDGRNRSDIS